MVSFLYAVFESQGCQTCKSVFHHPLQVWQEIILSWGPRTFWNHRSRLCQEDKDSKNEMHECYIYYTQVHPLTCFVSFFWMYMVDWFEKCSQLWIQGGPQRDEALLTLAEDFFDSLMVSLYHTVTRLKG